MDASSLLAQVEAWCAAQQRYRARLVKGAPLSHAAIDQIPQLPSTFWAELPTPYDPQRFIVPAGYRALLELAGGVRVEYLDGDDWQTYEVFNLWRPGPCERTHRGARETLCDSWLPAGTEDDQARAITTTELLSFASMGYSTEASRWCFFVPARGPIEPPGVMEESNDYECLAARYVDTGEWISDLEKPAFPSFETWFEAVVTTVTQRPLDPATMNDTIREIYKLS